MPRDDPVTSATLSFSLTATPPVSTSSLRDPACAERFGIPGRRVGEEVPAIIVLGGSVAALTHVGEREDAVVPRQAGPGIAVPVIHRDPMDELPGLAALLQSIIVAAADEHVFRVLALADPVEGEEIGLDVRKIAVNFDAVLAK